MASIEMKKRKREEYEMQLFGFHSRTVHATLKSLIQEKIKSRCRKLCESLAKKYDPEEDGIAILKKNGRKLMEAYYRGSESQSQALENCMERLINIPENVLLHEDKIQANQYTNENITEMKAKLVNLQQRLKQGVFLNEILNEEIEIIEQLQPNIHSATVACDVIEDGIKYPDVNEMIIQLAESYEDLQSYSDKSDRSYEVRNKESCLMHENISYDSNSS